VTPRIVQIQELPSDQLAELVAESEQAGLQLVRRLQRDWQSGANRFDRPGEALFAAFDKDRAVGVCGLSIDPYCPLPRVGRVRHLYVLAERRRQLVGSLLVLEVMAIAPHAFDRLRLRANDPLAARFYEQLGFRRCEGDSTATHELELMPG
jgi:GNAT superfamily N-acetyltransferase